MAESFYTDADLIGAGDSDDATGLTLGDVMKFDVSGTVTDIRFRSNALSSGTYIGALFPVTGNDPPASPPAELAQATFGAITGGAWNTVALPAGGVAVSAGVPYRPAVYTAVGKYVAKSGFHLAGDVTRGHITALGNGSSAGGFTVANGTFNYATGLSYPSSQFGAATYFVDLVFVPDASGPSEGLADAGLGLAIAAVGGADHAGIAGLGLDLAVAATGVAPGVAPSQGVAAVTLGMAVAAVGTRSAAGIAAVGLRLAVSSTGEGQHGGVAGPRLISTPRPGRIVTRTQVAQGG